MLQDIKPEYNFSLVDLGSNKETFESDPRMFAREYRSSHLYYYKANFLETRTWLFSELLAYEASPECADMREAKALRREEHTLQNDDGEEAYKAAQAQAQAYSTQSRPDEDVLKDALRDFHIERSSGIGGGLFGCHSPMYNYALICFLANCTGDNTMAVLSIVALFVVNAGTLTCNTIYRVFGYRGFQLARLVSLPVRLVLVAQAWGAVGQSYELLRAAGLGVEVLTVVLVVILSTLDLRNDVLQCISRFVGSKFEIIDTLPGNIFICKKINRMGAAPLGGSGASIGARIVGQHNKKVKGVTLIANCGGLLVELSELTTRECELLEGNLRVFQTKTFDYDCMDYLAVKDKMELDEQIAEAEEREKKKKKQMMMKQHAKTEAEKKRLSVAMGLEDAEAKKSDRDRAAKKEAREKQAGGR
jgi:hypothetical protein